MKPQIGVYTGPRDLAYAYAEEFEMEGYQTVIISNYESVLSGGNLTVLAFLA